jgi:hypothetical protein
VIRWARQLAQSGRAGLKQAGRAGRKPKLSASQLRKIERALNAVPRRSATPADCGPRAGCASSSRTSAGCAITKLTSGASCASSGGAASAPPGGRWSATRRRSGTGNECAGHGLKKSARRAAHHRLHRRNRAERAAPSGAHLGPARTDPGAAISFQLEGALGVAGITWWNFYFRIYRETIRAPQVVDFLAHLLRHLPGRLLVIWDRSKTHRSHLVGEFVAGQRGRLALDYLPAYAPELDPGEYMSVPALNVSGMPA